MYGIKAFASNNLIISNNNFNIKSNVFNSSGALQLNNSEGSIVNDNTIKLDGTSFGISSNVGSNNTISNNNISYTSYFYLPRLAAISSNGCYLERIFNDSITCKPYIIGMRAQNSNLNDYSCNNVLGDAKDGLYIGNNSEYHFIKGNKFIECNKDLVIRSRVGTQWYNGNEFYNGNCSATALNDDDLLNSKFYVNSQISKHLPSNPQPSSGWFEDDQYHFHFYNYCELSESKGRSIFNDAEALNAYFDDIKAMQTSAPEQFFVKLYHLFEYDEMNDTFSLTSYILNDPIVTSMCGLSDLANVIVQINKVSNLSGQSSLTEEDIESVHALQEQYINTIDGTEKELIAAELREKISSLISGYDEEFEIDSMAYTSLKNDLQSIDCNISIVQKWKDIYINYINFVQTGEVAIEYHSLLKEYSSECSDIYGDAIHLVRALTNTFDSTYYNQYDGCFDVPIFPRVDKENTLNAIVQPNPTKGIIVINLDGKTTGKVEIYNMSGRLIKSVNLKDQYHQSVDINTGEGVYLINILSDTGEKFIEKIVVIK